MRRHRGDLVWIGGLAFGLLAFFLWAYVGHGYHYPLGPDAPVYLWWARIGGAQGLSVVGTRPGAPALTLELAGSLHLSEVSALVGIEAALGVAVGLSVLALVRSHGGGRRSAWLLAGFLAGVFAVHLVAGYVANLAFAVAFVAATVAIANRTTRGAIAGAALLGAGGLAHPQFFLLGAGMLALVAAWSWIRTADHTEARHVAAAIAGAGAIVAVGLASMSIGPPHLAVDTSQDAFLRRAGLDDLVASYYRSRFLHRWTRYVQWVSIPLAVPGLIEAEKGFMRWLCEVWAAVLVVGIPLGLITGWFPADRLITFGYVVPILSALGLLWVWEKLAHHRPTAVGVTLVLVVLMVAGSYIAWRRNAPYISRDEVASATVAGRIAEELPANTPLVFVVDDGGTNSSFPTRAENVIRACVPPDRARNVYVYAGSPQNYLAGAPTTGRSLEWDTFSDFSLRDIPSAPKPVAFVLRSFYLPDQPFADESGFTSVTDSLLTTAPVVAIAPPVDPLDPTSFPWIALSMLIVLVALGAAGYGWARAAGMDVVDGLAVSPAFGMSALTLVAIAGERLGVPLTGFLGPAFLALVGGGGGYALRFVLERRTGSQAPPEVE
jgi:hypothetical protein